MARLAAGLTINQLTRAEGVTGDPVEVPTWLL